MQGLWSNHRRGKVNLNSPLPTCPPEISQAEEITAPNGASGDSSCTLTGEVVGEVIDTGPDGRPSSSGVKRKIRSSRTANGEETNKRQKSSASSQKDYSAPMTRLSDLGGVESCVEKMLELVAMPLCHPEIYLHTGVHPPRGVLLHGPPGCGKTLLAHAIAGELGVPFISVSAPSIVSDMSWDKTENKPVIVIGATNRPDALDAALRRAGRFDHEISMGVPNEEARAQILRVLCSKLRLEGNFDFKALASATPGYVGADLAALTGAAGVAAVKRIFQQLSEESISLPEIGATASTEDGIIVDTSESLAPVAQPEPLSASTIFSDLPRSLRSNSIVHFLVAHPNSLTESQLAPLFISFSDFSLALKQVQPSSKREGFTTVPDMTWADIGALHTIREELHMAIVQPIRRPELFKQVGISAPCGVLLWGPPGCGKTLLAKAVANESKANFISIKGPELLNKYVGESERAVRQVFARARASSPCVVFFDELDALVPRRDDSLSESSARMVNTLLTELDGLDERRGVYVIGATNRPDMIDPAMCRPGRLDKLLYVDLPSADERTEIIRTVTRGVPFDGNSSKVGLEAFVRERCDGFSGADLSALVREASVIALRRAVGAFEQYGADDEAGDINVSVTLEDFGRALGKLGPSVSTTQRKKYAAMRNKFAGISLKFAKDTDPEAVNVPASFAQSV
ncbi:hypothetical protein EW145_g1602 [Phellinidium pouzarii]|uniref:AAA+ ATPase domain-containing protein n=1 Tax=Phellinidium pouzarii TaxID=167371 RepID=A0A4S4LE79_9AGAM|nr:hypothetical protein EW145_g1602 [Phellinidium pouzarii]